MNALKGLPPPRCRHHKCLLMLLCPARKYGYEGVFYTCPESEFWQKTIAYPTASEDLLQEWRRLMKLCPFIRLNDYMIAQQQKPSWWQWHMPNAPPPPGLGLAVTSPRRGGPSTRSRTDEGAPRGGIEAVFLPLSSQGAGANIYFQSCMLRLLFDALLAPTPVLFAPCCSRSPQKCRPTTTSLQSQRLSPSPSRTSCSRWSAGRQRRRGCARASF